MKRIFDIILSLLFIIIFSWLLLFVYILSSVDTLNNGLFTQMRIGQFGKKFIIFKFRTFRNKKITIIGKFTRKYKLDELPQLFNILIGNMSFVGPRPDVEGYYDLLEGEERNILKLKPGLTSWASIKYSNEEELLENEEFPLKYNDEVIFPDKVKMNLEYYYQQSLKEDLKIFFYTIKKLIK